MENEKLKANAENCLDVFGSKTLQLTREREIIGGVDAGHIEQEERGAIHITQAHKHSSQLLPTAMAFVPRGFVLVQIQVQVQLQ